MTGKTCNTIKCKTWLVVNQCNEVDKGRYSVTECGMWVIPINALHQPLLHISLVRPLPRAPPGEKRSGEQSRISYYPKRVMTNEIVRSVIIICSTFLTMYSLHLSMRTFFKRVCRKMF